MDTKDKIISHDEFATKLWNEPKQERSRLRVAAIRQAALALIEEHGVERLGMREVAERANLPVGTLYQFFRDRNALLACLITRYYERLDDAMILRFSTVKTVDEFMAASDKVVGFVYHSLADDQALAEIWKGVQASKTIRHLDLQSSRKNADLIFKVLRPLVSADHIDERIYAGCFLICDLIGAAARTALEVPKDEGQRLVLEFEQMIRTYLESFLMPEKNPA